MNQIQNEHQPTTPTPEASGGQGSERTFTQEEVNRIVTERLARERAKSEPSPADEREQALKARESRLDCMEYLISKKLPLELLDVMDTSDTKKFTAAVETLQSAVSSRIQRYGFKPGQSTRKNDSGADPIASAFLRT